jgi:hypothetical protein
MRKNKEDGGFEIHRVLSSSSLEVPDKCIREREFRNACRQLEAVRPGDRNGRRNFKQASKSDEAREWN